jgi:anti-sigma regulatory factor (Ser/Thr protein kinase)
MGLSRELPIKSHLDVLLACRVGKEIAKKIGFERADQSTITFAISELANNVISYGGKGTILIRELGLSEGIEIICSDEGPGIQNIEQALQDGYSTQGRLGIGLPGVKRVMDVFEINSHQERGTIVKVRKILSHGRRYPEEKSKKGISITLSKMIVGVVSVPKPDAITNGDAYYVKEFDDKTLLVIVDGLGHGKGAEASSQRAISYIEKNYRKSLLTLIEGCHDELRGTRGVVIGIVLIKNEKLSFAGVGNVQLHVFGERTIKPPSTPGVVGYNLSRIRESEIPYLIGDIIVMHSDGISEKFTLNSSLLLLRNPKEIAEEIANEYGRGTDDETVIVASPII